MQERHRIVRTLKRVALIGLVLSCFGCWLSPGNGATPAKPRELKLYRALAREDVPHLDTVPIRDFHFLSRALLESLRDGWREEHGETLFIDANCIWSMSIVSQIELDFPRVENLVLHLRMRPHFIENIEPQRVSVVWNDSNIGLCEFSAARGWNFINFSLAVPASVQKRGKNRVTFLSRYCLSAKDVRPGQKAADARTVSFGLAFLQLLPPGEKPGSPGADPQPNNTPGAAATFANDAITQQPGTLLKIPVRMPESGTCVLRLAKDMIDPAELVTVRWDTMNGPKQRALTFRKENDRSGAFLDADLTDCVGSFAEIEFDAVNREKDAAVIWKSPAIWAADLPQPVPESVSLPPQPNTPIQRVIVVLFDALRADGLSACGALRPVSPSIDAIVRSGIVFDRAYSCASWTYPSIISLMTGCYPTVHRVYQYADLLSAEIPTLAEGLKKAGILTGCVADNPFYVEQYRLNRGFDAYHYVYADPRQSESRSALKATEAARQFMRDNAKNRFFLFIHFFPPHAPYAAGNPLAQTLTYDPKRVIPSEDTVMHNAEVGRAPKAPENVKQLRARYDENVQFADSQMQELLDTMHEAGFGKETAIIVTADHGEEFDEHGHLGHSDIPYDTLARVPFIVRFGPDTKGEGQHRSELVRHVDLLPTVFAWLGAAPPKQLPGRNLFATTPAENDTVLHYAVSEHDAPLEGFWIGRYKLLRGVGRPGPEVYDLALDPVEQSNLALLRPVLTDYLLAQAEVWRKAQPNPPAAQSEKVKTNGDTLQHLRALGYL